MEIRTRYAQDAPNHKAHIVPLIGRTAAKTALCGKQVRRWQMVTDEKPADCCQKCERVSAARGWARALEIIRTAKAVGTRSMRR